MAYKDIKDTESVQGNILNTDSILVITGGSLRKITLANLGIPEIVNAINEIATKNNISGTAIEALRDKFNLA